MAEKDTDTCSDPEKTGEPGTTGRGSNGQFLSGVSGNPNGRPAGRRNKASEMLESMMAEDWRAVADGLMEAAKQGNASAAKIVLDRVAPRPRGRPVYLDLPPVTNAEEVDKALNVVLAAVGDGAVTPSEAATIAGILEAKRRVIETTMLDNRVQKIERALEGTTRD